MDELEEDPRAIVEHVSAYTGEAARLYERSVHRREGSTYVLVRTGQTDRKLIILGSTVSPFTTEVTLDSFRDPLHVCPCTPENADALRATFDWTAPDPLGTTPALGCGDRLGLATPGHIRACRSAGASPVLAQQSMREMERTDRSPQEVLDDVTWAVFQEGYHEGFGADADHLKTTEAVDRCVAAGYTMYTIDPSDHVDLEADELAGGALDERFEALPWDALDTTPAECVTRYVDAPLEIGDGESRLHIPFDKSTLKRTAVKYAAALAHTRRMADHLAVRYREAHPEASYDLEMSIDETTSPTRPHEHAFVASELQRLDVDATSLAPRFVGDFQKGIDYIGDLNAFEEDFAKHAHIAASLGDYKLSIHSGSDKFSVYPIMGRHAGDRIHLKTAGTSYLEALRIAARHAPALFRDIVDFAFERFEADRATYHVTTDLEAIPDPETVPDSDLEPVYLDDDDGRQLLHLTYGSVLTAQMNGRSRFRDALFTVLNEHEEEHYDTLQQHLGRHIRGVQDGAEERPDLSQT